MDHKTYLRIADINIRVNSHTRHQLNDKLDWRYQNFVLKRPPRKIDLDLDLRLRDKYTRYRPVVLFETKREKINLGAENLPSGMENPIKKDPNHKIEKQKADYLGEESGWRISKYRGRFLIEGGSSGNFQAFFDKDFKRIDIFLINPSGQWKLSDVFTGFLQLFMIYYLAARRDGLVIHSAAIKDKQKDGRGYLFAGISGA